MNQPSTLNVLPFSREMNVLLAFNQIEYDTDERNALQELISDPGFDWDQFVVLVRHHRTFPTVYSNMSKLHLSYIPDEVIHSLRADYNKNTFQMLRLTAEMVHVCKCFEENQIRSLILKGPVIAQRLYGDINRRTCKDLDILVPYSQVDEAEQQLLALGYVPDYEESILNDREWRVHHQSYTNSQTGIQVELHWRLNPDKSTEPKFDELWERRNTSEIINYPVPYLGDEDLFLFLVCHGARHGWFRIRWLIDIDRLMREDLNWDNVIKLVKQYHALITAGQAVILANQLLGTPLTDEMTPFEQGTRSTKVS